MSDARAPFDIDAVARGVDRVCLFLGPYRNLTTLTAGVLSLHPAVQVLNHGKAQVFGAPEDNFIVDYTHDAFARFVRTAIALSGGGTRGDAGGSITYSHAFDHPAMRDAYRLRFGAALVKDAPRCLVWKESLRTSNAIRKHGVDLGALFAANDRIRFLMPIRHPIDCAVSNLKTGHYEILRMRRDDSLPAVLDAIVNEIAWFQDCRAAHPDRFFSFYQDGVDVASLDAMATFLGVASDERWRRDALACFATKPGYAHDESIVRHYRESVESRLRAHPDVCARLLSWA